MVMTPFDKPIYTTKPLLPPLESLIPRLQDIWSCCWLTNDGPQSQILEKRLAEYLGTPHAYLFNNGTVALTIALKALDLKGEVITTPFTFAATPHSLSWNNITPVFVDIDPISMTLDPACIEAAITPQTTGILGVHVYGIPCHVEAIEKIASHHGLKVIYDAAHAFGTCINNTPISQYGDISMFSLHATKLFHTAEGGVLTFHDENLKKHIYSLRNFGLMGDEISSIGTNGKLNELQAALGLSVFECINVEREKRKQIKSYYYEYLNDIEGLHFIREPQNVESSYQYFPIRIDAKHFGCTRDELCEKLKQYNIIARRYFYPLCSSSFHYSHLASASSTNLPIAHQMVKEVMCLPFYGDLNLNTIEQICNIIIDLHINSLRR